MSATWDIICERCKERLWIGQNRSVYTKEPHTMNALGDFLERHAEHPLKFVSEYYAEEEAGWTETHIPKEPT